MKDLQARFMRFIEKQENGCWLWTGTKHKKNGAMFSLNGKPTPAHRVSYYLFKGNVESCKSVFRTCNNSQCMNPDHLRSNAK